MNKYYPLIFVEFYLCLTLILFYFGPVKFRIHNPELFILLMILYHLSFILGYVVFTKSFKKKREPFNNHLSNKFFYSIFFIGFFGVLLSYQNLTLSSSFIPYNIISDIIKGLFNPDVVYAEKVAKATSSNLVSSHRWLNIISVFFIFSKLLFIPIFVYYWFELSKLKKFLVIIYSFFFIASGFATETNSVIFLFFIFVIVSFFITVCIKRPKYIIRILLLSAFLFLIPLGYFGYTMSQRVEGGGFEGIIHPNPQVNSSLGDISVNAEPTKLNSFSGFCFYTFVWLNSYLVQGYYGFSLILNMDWNWTYGFGNSEFLQRQFFMLSGIDISEKTFQYRVGDVWDKSAQWHSFYGQFANDFGLIGLSILMFILGGLFSKVWLSIIYNNNFFGIALLPLFALMFVFFPANNQVFGFIDTFSYFIFVTLFWFLKEKKIRFGANIVNNFGPKNLSGLFRNIFNKIFRKNPLKLS